MTGPVVYPTEFRLPCGERVPGEWRWDPATPMYVWLTVRGVPWMVGRDLLTAGVNDPAGDGDVVLAPFRDVDELRILLRGPSGSVVVACSLRVALDVVGESWAACDRAAEDAVVGALMDRFLVGLERPVELRRLAKGAASLPDRDLLTRRAAAREAERAA